MKTFLITLLLSAALNGVEATGNEASATVDRIEENQVVIEVVQNDHINMVGFPIEDFNNPVSEGEKIAFTKVCGKFYNVLELSDMQGKTDTYYQFKSDDNTVWWLLTAEDIGCVPSADKEYSLLFYDNGTTAENKPCDCLPELECECELYDDLFLGIAEEVNYDA